jgi:hypothetical protein
MYAGIGVYMGSYKPPASTWQRYVLLIDVDTHCLKIPLDMGFG